MSKKLLTIMLGLFRDFARHPDRLYYADVDFPINSNSNNFVMNKLSEVQILLKVAA